MTAIEHLTKVLKSLDNYKTASESGNEAFINVMNEQLSTSITGAKKYLSDRKLTKEKNSVSTENGDQ